MFVQFKLEIVVELKVVVLRRYSFGERGNRKYYV